MLTLVLIDPVLVDSFFFRILISLIDLIPFASRILIGLIGLIQFGSYFKIVNFNFLLIPCFKIVVN